MQVPPMTKKDTMCEQCTPPKRIVGANPEVRSFWQRDIWPNIIELKYWNDRQTQRWGAFRRDKIKYLWAKISKLPASIDWLKNHLHHPYLSINIIRVILFLSFSPGLPHSTDMPPCNTARRVERGKIKHFSHGTFECLDIFGSGKLNYINLWTFGCFNQPI